jgi:hypothetical protein
MTSLVCVGLPYFLEQRFRKQSRPSSAERRAVMIERQ